MRISVSLIIPVYNSEKYINKCLDSIFAQQFNGKYEVIAVDDGSSDKSLMILNLYQVREPRLIVIAHGINKKLSVARATGINNSSGDYIMHVDSDDWLLPDALSKLFVCCKKTNADIVVYNLVRENSNGKRSFDKKIKSFYFTNEKIRVQEYFYGACVNKIIKRKLVSGLVSADIGVNISEDYLYCAEVFIRSKTICLFPEILYVYFANSDSVCNHYSPSYFIKNQVIILTQLQLIFEKYSIDKKVKKRFINYYLKWIYYVFAEMHFFRSDVIDDCMNYMQNISRIRIISYECYENLSRSIGNKWFALYQLVISFNVLFVSKVLIYRLKNNILRWISKKNITT